MTTLLSAHFEGTLCSQTGSMFVDSRVSDLAERTDAPNTFIQHSETHTHTHMQTGSGEQQPSFKKTLQHT